MASMNEKDYYAILGVEKTATTDEIRRAFQKKAGKLHPDVNKEPDAEDRFKELSEAYAVLSDEEKRRRYDAMRSGAPFGGAAPGYGSPAGTAGYDGDPFGWGFPFGGAYSGRRTQATRSRSYNPKAGADIVYEMTLDDEAAAKGVRRGISYQRFTTCEHCRGQGSVAHAHPVTCPTCGGSGRMTVDLASLFGFGVVEMSCPECEGTGRVVEDPCESCGGSGRVFSASEVVLDVPAGTHDGDTVRMKGMGNAGTNGKASGDFVCRIMLPSERLTPQQSSGLGLMGFGLPFVVMGALGSAGQLLLVIGCLMVAAGAGLLVQGGLRSNARWLRHALGAVVSGAARGFFLVLLMVAGGPLLSWLIMLLPFYFLVSLFTQRVR